MQRYNQANPFALDEDPMRAPLVIAHVHRIGYASDIIRSFEVLLRSVAVEAS